MTAEKILGALQKYEQQLERYEPVRHTTSAVAPSSEEALKHVRWMCVQVHTFLEQARLEKAYRWLGFIQGTLWALGRGSVDDFREDNRNGEGDRGDGVGQAAVRDSA